MSNFSAFTVTAVMPALLTLGAAPPKFSPHPLLKRHHRQSRAKLSAPNGAMSVRPGPITGLN